MPNLVGIGNSQVPTNAMLGGLAYQDPAHANLTSVEIENIAPLKALISDTAFDVLVYDTRFDSDGGLWRKRCEHTSWYNEGPGEARGARKEFPSVAIIVARAYDITIYDGDDSNCPMWMRWKNGGIIDWATGSNLTRIKLAALNGQIAAISNDGGYIFKMIEDFTHSIYNGVNYPLSSPRYIAGRNESTAYVANAGYSDRTYQVPHYNMYDVCMWVNPGATISHNQFGGSGAAGGNMLPQPTIAVSTQNGVALIGDYGNLDETGRNDLVLHGTSSSGSSYSRSHNCTVTDEGWFWHDGDSYNSNSTHRDSFAYTTELLSRVTGSWTWSNSSDNISVPIQDGKDYTRGVNYNAICTKAESGNINIGESNDWHWTKLERNAIGCSQGFARWKPTILHSHNDVTTRALTNQITSTYNSGWMIGAAGSCGSWIGISNEVATLTAGSSHTINDCGTNNINIPVIGTLYADPVEEGADLMCIRGFTGTGSNPNGAAKIQLGSTVNIGNPAMFTIGGWCKTTYTGQYQYLISLYDATSGHEVGVALETGNGHAYFYDGPNSWANWNPDFRCADGQWHHVMGVYDANNRKILYVDGLPRATTGPSSNINLSNLRDICIGGHWGGSSFSYPFGNAQAANTGGLALMKYAGTAATSEQIKQMYDDEKPLFQKNAKCTLYGSSNAVTAIGYDKVKKIYHVGTSGGRSDFHGLARINNTTTAVTTCISASDGLIVEQ